MLKGELRRAVTVAAQNGYAGIGLRMRDYRRAVEEGRRDADLRAMLADSDVEVVELEVVWDWAETGGARTTIHRQKRPSSTEWPTQSAGGT